MSNLISDFYRDQDIFVTGGSGLMGKALIDKLLRSCAGLNRVFVLIRDRKGKSSDDRLEDVKKNAVFNRLKQENPLALNKLVAISGDIMEIGLGMSEADKKRMENVSIIFHVAATISFNESLKTSILLNVRGTREALNFAMQLKKFQRFVHVSTAYTYPYRKEIDEVVYPPMADWEANIKMAEKFDDNLLNALTSKITNQFPNTYSFTKHLGEQLVNDYKDKLPVVIVRPSIVSCSLDEPVPGWYDKFIGSMALGAGVYSGLLRTVLCDPTTTIDSVPLDICIKLFIILPWWLSSKTNQQAFSDHMPVFNATASQIRGYSAYMLMKMTSVQGKYAFEKTLWAPSCHLTTCRFDYYLRFYISHILPAIFMDAICKLTGKRPIMLRAQRNILAITQSYELFLHKTFIFRSSIERISNQIGPDPEFPLTKNLNKLSLKDICLIAILGIRRYLLNEADDSIPSAERRLRILRFIDFTIFSTLKLWIGYYFLRSTILP